MWQREQLRVPDGDQELDLWTGEVRDRRTGKVVGYLTTCKRREDSTAPSTVWNRRERVLATELLVATYSGPDGLHLFDMTLVWPSWLKHAMSFQAIRNRVNAPVWGINNALRPYGWHVQRIGVYRWVIKPDENRTVPLAGITAAKAIRLFDVASAAMIRGDHDTVLNSAVEALGHCGESLSALLLIGTCCFVHGCKTNKEIMVYTAKYVLGYEDNLGLERNVLIGQKQVEQRFGRDCWQCADDFIRKCEELLETHRKMFENARAFLYGG